MQVKGEPEALYKAGQSFYEAPNGIHAVSANAQQNGACAIPRVLHLRSRHAADGTGALTANGTNNQQPTRRNMQARFNYAKTAPGVYEAMEGLEQYIGQCGLEESLLHLIRLRASQINGCAYCLDMHWKDLRAIGENEQRLYSLDAWRECPYYSDRERAALAWTEAVTLVTEGHVPERSTGGAGASQRKRIVGHNVRNRSDQCLEPTVDRGPHRARGLPACQSEGVEEGRVE